jgi:hypothetical protein
MKPDFLFVVGEGLLKVAATCQEARINQQLQHFDQSLRFRPNQLIIELPLQQPPARCFAELTSCAVNSNSFDILGHQLSSGFLQEGCQGKFPFTFESLLPPGW